MTATESPFGRRRRIGVDVSGALNLVGSLIKYLGPSCLVPVIFAVAHGEPAWPFLAAGALVSGFGLALERVTHGAREVGVREGYLIISVTWLAVAAYGALPYVLAGDPQLGRPVDALFEGMSGFTTTGASTVTDVSALPVSIQIWRQLTVWLGGIGVVTVGLAVLPRLRVGGRQLLETEHAGPAVETGLSSRIRDTASRFGALYVALTAMTFLALALPAWLGVEGTMDDYQAFAHSLTTIGTGGFSTEPAVDRGVRRPDAVDGDRRDGDRGHRTSCCCTARSSSAARARRHATRSSGSTSRCSCSPRSRSPRCSGATLPRRAEPPCAPPRSRSPR